MKLGRYLHRVVACGGVEFGRGAFDGGEFGQPLARIYYLVLDISEQGSDCAGVGNRCELHAPVE